MEVRRKMPTLEIDITLTVVEAIGILLVLVGLLRIYKDPGFLSYLNLNNWRYDSPVPEREKINIGLIASGLIISSLF